MSKHEKIFYYIVDNIHRIKPQPIPAKQKLLDCKIISHRGEHDNKTILENTIEAFEKIAEMNVWGIEFDVRWTKDLIPIVFHDNNLWRLFRHKLKISEITFPELRARFPLIPSLAEVVQQFGNRLHLIIELKKEIYAKPFQQMQILQQTLSTITPIQDFHVISIYPELFEYLKFLPNQALLPIAITSYKKKSHLSFKKGYGGILGHYQFLSRYRINRHLLENHQVGVGFIASKNSLYRELNRGINWIFSNNAVYLQEIVNKHIH